MKSATDVAASGNETVVIVHPMSFLSSPKAKHVHHGREVVCKAGTNEIVLGPIARTDFNPADVVGGEQSYRYVRTDEKDELGRAIFKVAGAE